jgi:hypothetical protein
VKSGGRDRVVTVAMMLVRLGFVVAIVLGLGMMFGLWGAGSVLPLHIGAGVLVLVGILLAGGRARTLGRGGVSFLLIGLLTGAVGAVAVLRGWAPGLLHLVLMLVAVGLAEMNVAKLNKAA